MKITKARLKSLIKEELEAVMQEQGGDEMAIAEELAAVFQKSPTIMAAVEQAAQDPKVQAAAQEALAQSGTMQEDEDSMGDAYRKDSMGDAYRKRAEKTGIGIATGGALATGGLAALFSPAVLTTIGSTAAATSTIGLLGFTAGPALLAVGMVVFMKYYEKRNSDNHKATFYSARSASDFSPEEYRKIRRAMREGNR
jgi:uncharacterized BrkB/YihY/UPF0761 family membrane protein